MNKGGVLRERSRKDEAKFLVIVPLLDLNDKK